VRSAIINPTSVLYCCFADVSGLSLDVRALNRSEIVASISWQYRSNISAAGNSFLFLFL
jgi:hypothetical protein